MIVESWMTFMPVVSGLCVRQGKKHFLKAKTFHYGCRLNYFHKAFLIFHL